MESGNSQAGSRLELPDDHVFVVRLWLERGRKEKAGTLWRGRVKYLNSGEETHVDGLEEALDKVRTTLRDWLHNVVNPEADHVDPAT